ncbi:ABC transporter substrate-binding protein [Acinetobacter halotolerans]|uniref:ABC transporter substrate-binding protein n=1 Tax=Acinetobacter halotolerans TaxID=1752076 RepID=A0A4Q6XL52_9GAMM|nr:substrate-binding domain-containing protein [Acinetobacter halotolerans]RZF55850.1 ABC transporter substrate-binding protein [Acinetobacter halotolerans]
MKKSPILTIVCLASFGFGSVEVYADTLKVISSGGFYSSMEKLIPLFEEKTGHTIELSSGSSMGTSTTSIPNRLERGEQFDVVILASPELNKLIDKGYLDSNMHVDLVNSRIGMAIPKGAKKPDISSAENFKKALLNARQIGYSASASGTHLEKDVFPSFPPVEYKVIANKAEKVVGDRVAKRIAEGQFDIGFQQISEIKPFTGKYGQVKLVGPIPAPFQKVTIFSAGMGKNSNHKELAKELIQFVKSPQVTQIIDDQGLEQIK